MDLLAKIVDFVDKRSFCDYSADFINDKLSLCTVCTSNNNYLYSSLLGLD